jgi:type II secretory pathway component PulF
MQIVLLISFLFLLGSLIGYIGSLFSSSGIYTASGTSGSSGFAKFMHAFIDLAIAGGIFGYYWYKLHRKTGRDLR